MHTDTESVRGRKRWRERDEVCFQVFLLLVMLPIHCYVVLVHQRPPHVPLCMHTTHTHAHSLYFTAELNKCKTQKATTTVNFEIISFSFDSICSNDCRIKSAANIFLLAAEFFGLKFLENWNVWFFIEIHYIWKTVFPKVQKVLTIWRTWVYSDRFIWWICLSVCVRVVQFNSSSTSCWWQTKKKFNFCLTTEFILRPATEPTGTLS